MAPTLTQREYHDLRVERSSAARSSSVTGEIISALYQRCQTCGKCELAGGFCSWCTTDDYTLELHLHLEPARVVSGRVRGSAVTCPLAKRVVARDAIIGTYRHLPGASQRPLPGTPDPLSSADAGEAGIAPLAEEALS